jgi:hypothetical protein
VNKKDSQKPPEARKIHSASWVHTFGKNDIVPNKSLVIEIISPIQQEQLWQSPEIAT